MPSEDRITEEDVILMSNNTTDVANLEKHAGTLSLEKARRDSISIKKCKEGWCLDMFTLAQDIVVWPELHMVFMFLSW